MVPITMNKELENLQLTSRNVVTMPFLSTWENPKQRAKLKLTFGKNNPQSKSFTMNKQQNLWKNLEHATLTPAVYQINIAYDHLQ